MYFPTYTYIPSLIQNGGSNIYPATLPVKTQICHYIVMQTNIFGNGKTLAGFSASSNGTIFKDGGTVVEAIIGAIYGP